MAVDSLDRCGIYFGAAGGQVCASRDAGDSCGPWHALRAKNSPHSRTCLSRSAFAITDTELKVIAALAIIGLSTRPKNG